MRKSLLFIRQHGEAAQLAGAASLVAPSAETEVVHLEADAPVPSARSQVIVDAAIHALSERGVVARGAVLQTGRLSVADRIQQLIQEAHPELVVLGARRLGRVGAMLQGSVTQQVLSGCPTMALVVPEDATVFEPPLRHVLVAVGGDDDLDRLVVATSSSRQMPSTCWSMWHGGSRCTRSDRRACTWKSVKPQPPSWTSLHTHSSARVAASGGPCYPPDGRRARSPGGAYIERRAGGRAIDRPGPFRTLTATSTAREVLVHVALPVLFAPVP